MRYYKNNKWEPDEIAECRVSLNISISSQWEINKISKWDVNLGNDLITKASRERERAWKFIYLIKSKPFWERIRKFIRIGYLNSTTEITKKNSC